MFTACKSADTSLCQENYLFFPFCHGYLERKKEKIFSVNVLARIIRELGKRSVNRPVSIVTY